MSDTGDMTVATGPGAGGEGDGDEAFCPACGQSYPVDTEVCAKDGARLAKLKAQPDSLLGRVFQDRYEVRMALGQGGMGTVYRGWQRSVDREVAIKVIHPKLASDRTIVKRFLREARLSSRLSQPSVVNVYDFGQSEDGILFLVMELLRGHTLARELDARMPLPLRRVITIGLQLCDALDAAHAQGIVHRDLKPGNIVILDDPPGRDLIKVLDFGLAKSLTTDTSSIVTHTNGMLGTPLYMAPEQIEGKASDQRGDLYSLGCILYHMLAGVPPFLGESVNVVLAKHLSERPPPLPLPVPGPVVSVIEQLLAKDPTRRTSSAREVHQVLQSALEAGVFASDLSDTTPDIPQHFRPTTPLAFEATQDLGDTAAMPGTHGWTPDPDSITGLTRSPPSSRRWLVVAVLAVIVAATSVVVMATRGTDREPTPERQPVSAPPVTIDARMPVDAAVMTDADVSAPIDVAVPIDAAAVVRPRPDARPRKPKPDAGTDIQFLPVN